MRELSVLKLSSSLQVVSLTVLQIVGGNIQLQYIALPGNNPVAFGNFIGMWQSTLITLEKPLAIEPVTNNRGMVSFSGLQEKNYIFGYSVAEDVARVCSTASIPPTGSDYSYFQISLEIVSIAADSLMAYYSTPAGSTPLVDGHWMGIWEGTLAGFQIPTPPIGANNIQTNDSEGTLGINVPLKRGKIYTMGYFLGGYVQSRPALSQVTMMGAIYQFSTC